MTVSSETGLGLDLLREEIWDMVGLMRIYASRDGQKGRSTGDKPLIVPRGFTVDDVARYIHKDLGDELKRAAVWGPSAKFPGQIVGRDHVLMDLDCVEIQKR